MKRFNESGKSILTLGEALDPAMEITTKVEADLFLLDYMDYLAPFNKEMDRYDLENLAKYNIGYYSGYFDIETRKRVEELFECKHPILGSYTTTYTPAELIEMGIKRALR